jgi:hypothetical protein
VAGEYSGSFSNAGELLRLVDSSGATIHEWMFADQAPWPEAADGNGYSLEVLDLNGDYNDPTNWTASALLDGTPGSPGPGRLVFTGITCFPAELHLFLPVAPGLSYTLYRSDTLAPASWLPFHRIPPSHQPRLQEILLSPSAPQQFYRISSP